jgi:hypothetical protein
VLALPEHNLAGGGAGSSRPASVDAAADGIEPMRHTAERNARSGALSARAAHAERQSRRFRAGGPGRGVPGQRRWSTEVAPAWQQPPGARRRESILAATVTLGHTRGR